MRSRGKAIKKPPVDERFFYGRVVSWKFRSTITPHKSKYCFRFSLTFENGITRNMQIGGFQTKSDAEHAREEVITALSERRFVPFKFTAKEFFDYWLYYYMIDERNISYNTFTSYRNIIYNYFLKFWGDDKKISALDRGMLVDALVKLNSPALRQMGYSVVGSAFSFAKKMQIIEADPSSSAIKIVRGKYKKRTAPVDEDEEEDENYVVLTAAQAAFVLCTAKEKMPDLFMPLLFTITSGLRISEALGVKFADVGFEEKMLHVKGQAGRDTKNTGIENGELYCQVIAPKSKNGCRDVPLADFVIDEIIMSKQRYDLFHNGISDFHDYGFICCQKNGRPFHRSNLYKKFHLLLKECGIEDFKWHGLRHTYSSLLAEEGISMKAVSDCMGHYSEGFTQKKYVTLQKKPVYDAVSEIERFWEGVHPSEKEIYDTRLDNYYALEILGESYESADNISNGDL